MWLKSFCAHFTYFNVQHWPQILHQGTGSTVSRSHSCWTAAAHFNSGAQIFLDLACGGPFQAGSYSFCSYNYWNHFAFSGQKKKKNCTLPNPLMGSAISLRSSGSFCQGGHREAKSDLSIQVCSLLRGLASRREMKIYTCTQIQT